MDEDPLNDGWILKGGDEQHAPGAARAGGYPDDGSVRMSSSTRRISAPLRVIRRSPACDQRRRPPRSMMTLER
jgi:hypothetical protein